MTVCIYGGGNYANMYIPLLEKKYDIAYILDISEDKRGQKLFGYTITEPDADTVNKYPIIITMAASEEAYKILKLNNCRQTVYEICTCYKGLFVFENNFAPISEIIEKGVFLESLKAEDDLFEVKDSSVLYNNSKNRIFNIMASENDHAHGGPEAGWRILAELNENYKLIPDFYSVYFKGAIIPKGTYIDKSLLNKKKDYIADKSVFEELLRFSNGDPRDGIRNYFWLGYIWNYLKALDSVFSFRADDIFILQDIYITQVFIHCFHDLRRIISVSHTQGTFGNERIMAEPGMKEAFDAMQLVHLKTIREWVFPSAGAKNGFYSKANEAMREEMDKCNISIIHGGYQAKNTVKADKAFEGILQEIRKADVIFASASFLYHNKGVDRIPRILSMFKEKTGLKIKWILVGSGEMEQKVQNNLKKYLTDNDYIWYKQRFDNQDNIFRLFQVADFYIMMHRVSVWDLSTLQAMSYGCIPVLSAVGGNLELCAFDNGILVDVDKKELNINNYLADGKLDYEYLNKQKEKNKKIIKSTFNLYNWINGYADLINNISWEKN